MRPDKATIPGQRLINSHQQGIGQNVLVRGSTIHPSILYPLAPPVSHTDVHTIDEVQMAVLGSDRLRCLVMTMRESNSLDEYTHYGGRDGESREDGEGGRKERESEREREGKHGRREGGNREEVRGTSGKKWYVQQNIKWCVFD